MAYFNNLSRWYVVLFFIFIVMILIICSYNVYEHYRIKTQVPKEFQESQDILFVLNIIGIVLALILLIGFYFARDKSVGSILGQAINIQDNNPIIMPSSLPTPESIGCPQLGPFGNMTKIDINRL